MIDWVFIGCAVLGGGVFVLRVVVQFLGVGGDDGVEPTGDVGHHDADAGFRLLSLQGLSAFLMMFGFVGLALVRESGVTAPVALGVGSGAGLVAVWVISRLFAAMGRLQSSGTLNMQSAIGQEGTVYLTVQAGGAGKVQVVVQGRLGVFDARAQDGAEIPTGKRVRVVAVSDADVLVVQAIENKTAPTAAQGSAS